MSDASYYQGLANQESQKYEQAIAQKGVVDEKITRLETAKTDLSTQRENFQTGIIEALENIKGEDESQFKGDRKTKYAEQYELANTAATTNKTSHDTNLTSIANMIEELQTESANLQAAADTAYTNMTNYQAAANNATS